MRLNWVKIQVEFREMFEGGIFPELFLILSKTSDASVASFINESLQYIEFTLKDRDYPLYIVLDEAQAALCNEGLRGGTEEVRYLILRSLALELHKTLREKGVVVIRATGLCKDGTPDNVASIFHC